MLAADRYVDQDQLGRLDPFVVSDEVQLFSCSAIEFRVRGLVAGQSVKSLAAGGITWVAQPPNNMHH